MGVRCAAPVGERLWVGLADGGVRVFETGPKAQLLAHFEAHDSAVVSIAQVCEENSVVTASTRPPPAQDTTLAPLRHARLHCLGSPGKASMPCWLCVVAEAPL